MPLLGDLGNYQWLIDHRPLLAHYTSMHVLEQILKNEEIWFSNPLFMNDLEEMRFGMQQGSWLFEQSKEVNKACGTLERQAIVQSAFRHYYSEFDSKHALNVFVFCLSQHDPNEKDGVLSMWRAYGRHGEGAALIFSTHFIVPRSNTPLIVAQVHYASANDRVARLASKLREWCIMLENAALPDDKLHLGCPLLLYSDQALRTYFETQWISRGTRVAHHLYART